MIDVNGDAPIQGTVDVSRTGAVREAAKGSFELLRFERDVFPFLQSRQWIPAGTADGRDRVAGAYDIVFAGGVLERLADEARRAPGRDVVGLFYGRGCECPWTRRYWLRVERATQVAARGRGRGLWNRPPPEEAHVLPIERRLAALVAARAGEGHVLGWFRLGTADATELSPAERLAHERVLPEPWQFAVKISILGAAPHLGLFGRDESGRLTAERPCSFYELEGRRERHRRALASNYVALERPRKLPGASPAWREVGRRRASTLTTVGCAALGVGLGLALSFELAPSGGVGSALGSQAAFASPIAFGGAGPASPARPVERFVDDFERRLAAYTAARRRPADGPHFCEDLVIARAGVEAAFINVIRHREELAGDGDLDARLQEAVRAKGRVDADFDGSGCPR